MYNVQPFTHWKIHRTKNIFIYMKQETWDLCILWWWWMGFIWTKYRETMFAFSHWMFQLDYRLSILRYAWEWCTWRWFCFLLLPSHLRYIQSHQILIDLACFGSHWTIVGHFLRTLNVSDVVYNVFRVTLMAMSYDPDASFHFQCQHDVVVRIDSHIHVNLGNVTLDNESNVQVSRSPRNAAYTKAIRLIIFFLPKIVCFYDVKLLFLIAKCQLSNGGNILVHIYFRYERNFHREQK